MYHVTNLGGVCSHCPAPWAWGWLSIDETIGLDLGWHRDRLRGRGVVWALNRQGGGSAGAHLLGLGRSLGFPEGHCVPIHVHCLQGHTFTVTEQTQKIHKNKSDNITSDVAVCALTPKQLSKMQMYMSWVGNVHNIIYSQSFETESHYSLRTYIHSTIFWLVIFLQQNS